MQTRKTAKEGDGLRQPYSRVEMLVHAAFNAFQNRRENRRKVRGGLMGEVVAFDIETASLAGEDRTGWVAGLGVSCVATIEDGKEPYLWHTNYAPRMVESDVVRLIGYLADCARAGMKIVTWNGLGFDFRVLSEEVGYQIMQMRCADLAMNHVDPAFQMLCEKGYMIGLGTAAKGLGLPGKTEGMKGALAPEMWASGREEQDKVLEYVAQDARTTLDVYKTIMERGYVSWVSKSGRYQVWKPITNNEGGLLTVKESLALPEPDTSWMDAARPRNVYYGWAVEGV